MSALQKATPIVAVFLLLGFATVYRPTEKERPTQVQADGEISNAPRKTTDGGVAPNRTTFENATTHPESLSHWLDIWRQSQSAHELAKGMDLAKARRKRMAALIRADPGAAIDEMLSYQDYRDLPDVIATHIEKPFATFDELNVVHHCFGESETEQHDHDSPQITAHWGGRTRRIFLPGERKITHTKDSFPLVGIELDGNAALHRLPAPILTATEAKAAVEVLGITLSHTVGIEPQQLTGNTLTAIAQHRDKELSLNQALYLAERSIAPDSAAMALQAFGDANVSSTAFASLLEDNDRDWSSSPKTYLIARVAFANHENFETKERLEDVLDWVSDTLFEYSFGKVTIEYTIPEVITLPRNIEYYYNEQRHMNSNALREAVDPLLARNGYPIDNYDIIAYQWEPKPRLGVGGAAETRYQYIRGIASKEIFLHETGHSFGLSHANSWNTDDGSILPPFGQDQPGEHFEYGDHFDRMGRSPDGKTPHFNAYFKRYLDWIPEENAVTIDSVTERTIRIHRFDHPKALQKDNTLLVQIDYPFTHPLALSYRRAFTDNENLLGGVYIQWIYYPSQARLLDMTPESGIPEDDWNDPALPVGSEFKDSLGNVSITPIRTGGDDGNEWIEVRIRTGSEDNSPPSLALAGPTHSPLRYPVSFSIEAADPENDPLEILWQVNGVTSNETSELFTRTFWETGDYEIKAIVHDGHRNYTTKRASLNVSDPLMPWTSFAPLEEPPHPQKLKFSGGSFLAFNEHEGIATPDGKTLHRFDPNILLGDVSIGQNIYVAVGASPETSVAPTAAGRIEQSLDNGKTWLSVPLPQAIPKLDCTLFAEGAWLAAGPAEIILRKAGDGDWQVHAAPWQERVVSLEFAKGRFLALTEWGKLYSSVDDGLNWIDTTPSIGVDSIEALASGDGLLLAVADGNAFVSSNGGVDWSQSSLEYEDAKATGADCSANLFYIAAETKIAGSEFTLWVHDAISIDGSVWKLTTEILDAPPTAIAIGNQRVGILWPSGVVEISSPHRSAFSNWMADALPSFDRSVFNPAHDSDGDGIIDIGEYSFNTRLSTPDTDILSVSHLQESELVTFHARSDNPYLRYFCALSQDLENWETIPLRFDSNLKVWNADSDLIEVNSLETEKEVWRVSLRLSPGHNPIFIQLSSEYDSPLP